MNRLLRLDPVFGPGAFRIILALLVFVSHMSQFNVGRIAVMLFFVLSGFWVTSIWRRTFSGHNPAWFYASRYFRIIPVYLLVVVPVALLADHPLLPNLLLFGIASNPSVDVISVSWSLDIELQFYLLLPLMLAAVPRVGMPLLLASIAVGAAGWGLAGTTDVATVLQYLPAFAIGAFIHDNQLRPSQRTAVLSLAGFGALTLAFWLIPATSPFLFKTRELPAGADIHALIWMLPLMPYVARSLFQPSPGLDRHLGNISYPFYLVHTSVILWLGSLIDGIGLKLAALIVSSALAIAIYWLFDRPIEGLRHRLFTPGKAAKL